MKRLNKLDGFAKGVRSFLKKASKGRRRPGRHSEDEPDHDAGYAEEEPARA